LELLKQNGHIKLKVNKYEKLEQRKDFKAKIENFKKGEGFIELTDYILNESFTIHWIENDYFAAKWEKYKKELPKSFNIDEIKEKDEEIQKFKEYTNLKRKRNDFVF